MMKWAFWVLLGISHSTMKAHAECPAAFGRILSQSTHLIRVEAADQDAVSAQITMWERSKTKKNFRRVRNAPTNSAVVGKKGLGWGWTFRDLALADEVYKQEGDKKAPRGIFRLGLLFGFAQASEGNTNYLRLQSDTECVDDVDSSHYNQITFSNTQPRDWRSSEKMRSIGQYEVGALIDYPSNAGARAGSCIFTHIWESSTMGTSGCVASSKDNVEFLHQWLLATPNRAPPHVAIAILTSQDYRRFADCF